MAGFRRVLTLGASFALLAAPGVASAAPAGPWDAFNLSPSASRVQLPRDAPSADHPRRVRTSSRG